MPPVVDSSAIVTIIVDSATDYLVVFSPIFILIGGLLLAYFIGLMLLTYFFPQRFARDEDSVL